MTEIFEDIIKNIDGLVKKVSKKSEAQRTFGLRITESKSITLPF